MEARSGERHRRSDRLRKFWSGNNQIRLMLTLELAVMLPAAALIYINFYHLKSIERDKVLEAAIHGDFHQMLAISEKQINQKAYKMTEEVQAVFPSQDADSESDKVKARRHLVKAAVAVAGVSLRRGARVPVSFAAAADERSAFSRGAPAHRQDARRVVRL